MITQSEWTREALTARGFSSWIPWSECPSGLDVIDGSDGGVYVIFRNESVIPTYLSRSPAGTFRGDPAVDRAVLDANWVSSAQVVYIGKANHGRLRKRLAEFIDFGRGGKRRHWGGRLIWQLEGSEDLLVAWRALPKTVVPKDEEDGMIAAFKLAFGERPFANNPDRMGQ